MDIKPKNLFKRVLRFARDELERRSSHHEGPAPRQADAAAEAEPEGTLHEADARAQASAYEPVRKRVDDHADEAAVRVQGLEVLRSHEGGPLTLRWDVSKANVSRAQAQLDGKPVLCVRLVSFSKGRDAVLREVQDRPGVDLVGECEIAEPPARAVVSLGLRMGDRFVSIAHHVI